MPESTSATATPVLRYQVFQEAYNGKYTACFMTDEAENAVEAFMCQEPAFEGGGVRLLDHVEKRMVGFVKWETCNTEIGMSVLHRQNVFHDWNLALIACVVQEQLESRAAIELTA